MLKNVNQKTLFGERVLKSHQEFIDNEVVQVFVTLDKQTKKYYNIYVVNERFKTDNINSLYLQESINIVKDIDAHFNIGFMIEQVVRYIIWSRFQKYGIPQIAIDIEFEPK